MKIRIILHTSLSTEPCGAPEQKYRGQRGIFLSAPYTLEIALLEARARSL
jgi:hypothetical protein